jgi:uncharacterized protein (TIGR03000 family)
MRHWFFIGAGTLAVVLFTHEPASAQKGGGGSRGGGGSHGGASHGGASHGGASHASGGVRMASPSGIRIGTPGGTSSIAPNGVRFASPNGVNHGNIYHGANYQPGGYYHNNSGSRVAIVIGGYPFGGGYFSPYRNYLGGYGAYGGGGFYGSVAGFGSYYVPSYGPYPDDPGFVPQMPPVPQAPPVANGYAHIQVLLPDGDGEVWFDGRKTRQTGTTRLFASPQLEPGKTYSYQVSAAWHQNGKLVGDERSVSVAPGTTTIVDFSRPAPEMKKE